MANELYTNYKVQCVSATDCVHGDVDLAADAIKVSLATTDTYTFDVADQDYADITIYLNTTDQTLTSGNITTTGGVVDYTLEITFDAVDIDGSSTVDELVHWYDTTTPATSPLICQHFGFTPVNPNGGNIVIAYHDSGIYAI
jgi:hypothetical protein